MLCTFEIILAKKKWQWILKKNQKKQQQQQAKTKQNKTKHLQMDFFL